MSGRFWLSLLLIVFGFGFLLQQAGVWNFYHILSTWWPLVLIVIGVIQLIHRSVSTVSGLLFIAIGGLFLANQWVPINLTACVWPLILILVGFAFIFSRPTASDLSTPNGPSIAFLSFPEQNLGVNRKISKAAASRRCLAEPRSICEMPRSQTRVLHSICRRYLVGLNYTYPKTRMWRLPVFRSSAVGKTK